MKKILTLLLVVIGLHSAVAEPTFATPPPTENSEKVDKLLAEMHDLEAAMGAATNPAPAKAAAKAETLVPAVAKSQPATKKTASVPAPADPEATAIKASAAVTTITVTSPPTPNLAPAAAEAVSAQPVVKPAATVSASAPEIPSAAPAVTVPPVVTAPAIPNPAPAAVTPPAAPANPSARNVPTRRAAAAAPANSTPTAATGTEPSAKAINGAGDTIPAGMIRFQAMPLEQVLDIYGELVGRTLLRPSSLPAASITIRAQTDLTRAEALAALDSVLGMNGIATIPFGEKFMKVVPTTSVNTEGAPVNELDASTLGAAGVGGYVTHVVQLKNSKPSEVAQALGTFSKIQGSILPLDSNGILIIRDFTENVKRMLELIDKIDVSVPSEFVSEVIPIRYATATEIASALNSVGGTTSGSIGTANTTAGAAAGATGRTGAGGGITSLAGQRTGANGQNTGNNTAGGNRFGAQAGGANQVGGAAGGQNQTFQQRLQNILSRSGAGGAGEVQLIGPNKIIADERTNSLLVFATRADMDMIKDIIAKLDVVLAQVLIEAVILDVTLGDDFDFGVSVAQKPKVLEVDKNNASTTNLLNIIGAGGMNNGASFLNFLSGSIGTNAAAGAFGNSLNGGLSYFGNIGPTWDVAIAAVTGNSKGKVLARPRIQTSHNAPATFFVGETQPYITGSSTDFNGANRSTYSQIEIGIRLTVTPLINSEGLVVMDIQQEANQANRTVLIDQNQVPVTQNQNASAKVSVKNGDTIVMGGFIQNIKKDGQSGVPVLMDIPLLGGLFRHTTTSSSRRELLVMIRPTVLPTPEAAALQPNIERNRLPAVKEAEIDFNREDAKLLKAADKKKIADDKRLDAEELAAEKKAARAKKK